MTRMRREQSTEQREIGDHARAQRLTVIRDELLARIRPICASMPDDLFLEMIDGMAAIQLKYELHDAVSRK